MRTADYYGLGRFVIALAMAGAAPGCSGESSKPNENWRGGTVVIGASADPDALFPPAALSMEARQATELIYEYLADVGVGMNTVGDNGFEKQIASEWTWAGDSSSIAFTINPAARWHDGRRVKSSDVAFSYRVYSSPAVGSSVRDALTIVDSLTTPDSTTAVFWFARPGPRNFFTAAAMMLILPQHIYNDIAIDSLRSAGTRTRTIGSGKFRLGTWTRGASMELLAVDAHYRGVPNLDRVILSIAPDYRSGVMRLLGGEVDVFANVRQETIAELASHGDFELRTLGGMDYAFMLFNQRSVSGESGHSLFSSRDLRRAMTMALDREGMVKNLFDTLADVSIGPAVRAAPTTDTTLRQIPFDRAGAERILDSLGWVRPSGSAGGVRSRHGIPLRFRLLVPVSSLSRMRMSVLIQEQLGRAGIEVIVDQMDFAAFSARLAERNFDAALASWHLGSSPDAVRVTWTTSAAGKGGLNYGAYRNRDFDVLVDSALGASDLAASRELFRRANQVIVDDAPAVWLYEPRTLIAIHKRIRHPAMRPNAWWLSIGAWSIPVQNRISRDARPAAQLPKP